jgi:tol-pal system protein YbgF
MVISCLKRTLKCTLLAVTLSTISFHVFAEDAPVYDVDNYPPQFDEQSDAPMAAAARASQSSDVSHLSLDERVNRLEQQISNVQRTSSAGKLDDMQSALQSLRGQVDELAHQLQQMQKQQKTLYSDLDKRVSSGKVGVPAAATDSTDTDTETADTAADANSVDVGANADNGGAKANDKSTKNAAIKSASAPAEAKAKVEKEKPESQPNSAEEQQTYQTAYNLIKAKKYSEATVTLQKMLQKYPSGQFAANAHYWLGELYGLMGKNDEAVTEFTAVVKNYPDSPKMADSQLKLGLIYAAQLKWVDAKASFKKVINKYPGTGSAHLAAEQLKQIKQAGH